MNAKWNLRGVFIAAAAALLVLVFSAVYVGQASAKPSEPEIELRHHLAGSVERELSGTLTAMDDNSLTVGEVKIQLNVMTEIKAALKIGDQVKVHVIQQASGAYLAREVEHTEHLGAGFDDHGTHMEPGDDHGQHAEPGDDHGNHPEPGDDHGGKGK